MDRGLKIKKRVLWMKRFAVELEEMVIEHEKARQRREECGERPEMPERISDKYFVEVFNDKALLEIVFARQELIIKSLEYLFARLVEAKEGK